LRKKIKFYENNNIKINNKNNINNNEYELKMSNLEMLVNSYGEKIIKLKESYEKYLVDNENEKKNLNDKINVLIKENETLKNNNKFNNKNIFNGKINMEYYKSLDEEIEELKKKINNI
jgi:hypothetical protein